MNTTNRAVQPLRSAETLAARNAPMQADVTPSLAVIALSKAGFGPRPGDISAFNALGADETARLTSWIDQQLDPDSIDDSACDTLVNANNFVSLNLSIEEAWSQYVRRRIVDCPTDTSASNNNGNNSAQPREELERLTLLRAVHSKRQLLEVMCDLWHNHFHLSSRNGVVYSMLMRFHRDVIRPNALGNFRTLLEMALKSPSVLYYSANQTNSDTGENEGLARKLLDNYTLGIENYLGSNLQPDEVSKDANGFASGYVDSDVFEVARCFTGWSVDNGDSNCDTGVFSYRADYHDDDLKFVLGQFIWANQEALQDGLDVIDQLAQHPGTARHICRKLCQRLVSDSPSQALVDSAAAIFQAQWQADDQIAQVVRHIVLSTEFRNSWGAKIKRPFDFAAAAIRALQTTFIYEYGTSDGNDLIGYYQSIGQRLFFRTMHEGYDENASTWLNSTSMFRRWRFVNRLVERRRDSNDQYFFNVLNQTPESVTSAEELVNHWVRRLLGYTLTSDATDVLVNFMASGFNPTYALPYRTDSATQDRLRMLVALILMTPSNQWR